MKSILHIGRAGASLKAPPIFNGPARSSGAPWFTIKNEADKDAAEILIYDQIGEDWYGEGTSAKKFADALKAIPEDRKINVRINSPGGNVYDGIAIYTLLRNRRANVTTYVDGVAASIASVIALAGSKVHMARAAQFMIHDPWSGMYVEGREKDIAEEAQRVINALKSAKESILVAYSEKTGKTKDELSEKMSAESWFTGDSAKEYGFVDVVTNDAPVSNNFDLSSFKRVPEAFRKLQNSAREPGGHTSIMNRQQIIARLKSLGKTVDENSTDEQLIAQLDSAISEIVAKSTATPPAAAASTEAAALLLVQSELKAMREARDAERRIRIAGVVDNCIAERRVTADQRDRWITRAMADETVINDLQAMPQNLPPEGMPLAIITSDAPADICAGLLKMRQPLNSMMRGNDVSMKSIEANAKAKFIAITKNIDKLRHYLIQNAHNIDSDLQQDVIFTEGMRAFKRRILPLTAFSKTFNSVPLDGTDEVKVPYFPLFTTTSRTYVDATGYEFTQASDTEKKSVTINEREYQSFEFYSKDLVRQPYFDNVQLFMMQVEQLGVDTVANVLSIVTIANFATAGFTGAPGAFEPDDMIDLKVAADNAHWPLVGRSAIMKSEYEGALAKQLIKVNESGSDSALRRGVTGRIADFDIFGNASVPDNSQNLRGFINLPSAILVATSPIKPGPGVMKNLVKYNVVIDPDTGIAFEYRYWGDPDKDADREVVEVNYGFAKGEAAALQRIVQG